MQTVGVSELRNKLSEYLRRARLGDRFLVTDRGLVVAELRPPGHERSDPAVPTGLQLLAKRGLVTLGATAGVGLYPALQLGQSGRQRNVAQLLDEERGSW